MEKIMFKIDKKDNSNEVIAFFVKNEGEKISYYAHDGQHGECDIDYVKSLSRTNRKKYNALLEELKSIYGDIEVIGEKKFFNILGYNAIENKILKQKGSYDKYLISHDGKCGVSWNESLEYASFYWYDGQYNEAIETYFYDSNFNLKETLEAIGVKGDFFEYGDKKKISIAKKLSEEFYY